MARIRSVKPSVRSSLTVAEWPREVRLAWIYLWNYLDDAGRGVDDMRLVVAELFPLDRDVTEKKLDRWLNLMATTKTSEDDTPPLCRYEVAGRGYLHAVRWRQHQHINRPTPSVIPPCPIHEDDVRTHGGLTEDSRSDSRGERKGKERKGQEGSATHGVAATMPHGSRLPEPFEITDEMRQWAHEHGYDNQAIANVTAAFCDYWRGKAGKDGRKSDWPATWRNWLRREAERRPQRGGDGRGFIGHDGVLYDEGLA